MTPEELDEARAKEALRRLVDSGKVYCHEDIAALGARLAREGWTPPEPVDPDILAFREWAAKAWPIVSEAASGGHMDTSNYARCFLAGARMAAERERERAKVLLEFAEDIAKFSLNYGVRANRALAKYREAL